MSCCGSSRWNNQNRPEHNKFYKPENSHGCGCSSANGGCDKPSNAKVDGPLWNWEQKYGKLSTSVTQVIGEDGRYVWKIEKISCGPPELKRKRSCCSFGYKTIR